MKKIYSSIDIGTDSIKICIMELVNNKLVILGSSSTRTVGVINGKIIDENMVINSLKLAIKDISEKANLKIKKTLLIINNVDLIFKISIGQMDIGGEITALDIAKCEEKAIYKDIKENEQLITVIPIEYKIDGEICSNPKGLTGENLQVKCVVIYALKEDMLKYNLIFKKLDIEITDYVLNGISNYYEVKNSDLDRQIGAVVNIGYDTTNISIFNKGVIIKNKVLEIGSKKVDEDISYIYKLDKTTSRKLKETFAVSCKRYADSNDFYEIEEKSGRKLMINNYEISEIVEARLIDLFEIIKKEINNLTKREISYIIITGGITEMAGFLYLSRGAFGKLVTVIDMKTLGIRHNKYSSVSGSIKFFTEKLELMDIDYSMFNEDLSNSKKDDNILNKIFGYFKEL
ncbi:MAG: cell division FtsA domain-containing protein [Bacilli bacterium]